MMDLDFAQGLEFGRALEKLRHHGDRLDDLESGMSEIRGEIAKARAFMNRGGLLVALWTGGTLANIGTESGADLLRNLIRALFRIG